MSSEIFGNLLPEEVIREDHRLEEAAERTHATLARLRWHWTEDEGNPNTVSYRRYAADVGRSEWSIRKSVNAYVKYAHSAMGAHRTFGYIYDAEGRDAVTTLAAEVVAEQKREAGQTITPQTARRHYKDEVREIKHAVENKAEKLQEEGKEFTPDDQAEYAQKVAETKKRLRDHEEREQERLEASHSWQFMDAMARVGKARQQLRSALKIIRDTEFTDDEKEVIEQTNIDTQALSSMITAALTGDSGVDWDRELAALDGRAHDGQ